MESNNKDKTVHLNLEDALKRFMGDKEILLEVIGIYCAEASVHLENMTQLLTANEMQRLSQAAHKLKSESGSVGAVLAQELCAKLENSAAQGNFKNSAKQLEEVIAEIKTVLCLFSSKKETLLF